MPGPLENLRRMLPRQGEGKSRWIPGHVAVQRILEVWAEGLQKNVPLNTALAVTVLVAASPSSSLEIPFHVNTLEESNNSSLLIPRELRESWKCRSVRT